MARVRPKRAKGGGRKKGRAAAGPSVQQEFRIIDVQGVRVTSRVFKGYGFYVVPGRDYEPGNGKDELQRKLCVAVHACVRACIHARACACSLCCMLQSARVVRVRTRNG